MTWIKSGVAARIFINTFLNPLVKSKGLDDRKGVDFITLCEDKGVRE